MKPVVQAFLKSDSGVSAVEYAVLMAMVSVVFVVAWTSVGVHLERNFLNVTTAMEMASPDQDQPDRESDDREHDDEGDDGHDDEHHDGDAYDRRSSEIRASS